MNGDITEFLNAGANKGSDPGTVNLPAIGYENTNACCGLVMPDLDGYEASPSNESKVAMSPNTRKF